MTDKTSNGSQLINRITSAIVLDKTSPEETERIEIFLCVMKDLGMLRIEEEYEEAIFI
jgi:hypothetical protein